MPIQWLVERGMHHMHDEHGRVLASVRKTDLNLWMGRYETQPWVEYIGLEQAKRGMERAHEENERAKIEGTKKRKDKDG